jgi:pimeloyl-ACP methyl ester carboxylesterase
MILQSIVHSHADAREAIVLIHGMGSASTVWKPIVADLKSAFTVVMVDLPGHGMTPLDMTQPMDPKALATSVIETMHSLGIAKFHVVGNSLGGWIALEMAAMNPSAVTSVTGLAPAGLWLKPFVTRNAISVILRSVITRLKFVSPLLLRFQWVRRIGFKNVSPKWRDFPYELCLDAVNAMISATGYYPVWDGFLRKRFEAEIAGSVPVTVIFGDSDRTLPAATCQERSLVPIHTTWILLNDCGHAPMWDHPAEVVNKILITSMIKR